MDGSDTIPSDAVIVNDTEGSADIPADAVVPPEIAEDDASKGDDGATLTDTSAPPSTGRIPNNTNPCRDASYWPYSVVGGSPAVRVHYRTVAEEDVALETLAHATFTLGWQLTHLGFRMAPSDRGRCGPDDALDIFLWRNAPSTFTDAVREETATWWEDVSPYIVLDAFGELGGTSLASTVTHELNHVLQAADSWYDSPIAYEMTAMYVEDIVYDDDNNYLDLLEDFQGSPSLSLDYDDSYATLYMYGACIYLQYLEARYFWGDPSFIGRIWLGMRNEPDDNEPDLLDSLDAILSTKGLGYLDSVLEFARWRYYTGRRDDGRHLPEAGAHPRSAEVRIGTIINLSATPKEVPIANMLLGTTYVGLRGVAGESAVVAMTGDPQAQWVIQALPGLPSDDDQGDGSFVMADLGEAEVELRGAEIVLAITTLPGPMIDWDPDTRSQQRYRGVVTVTRAEP